MQANPSARLPNTGGKTLILSLYGIKFTREYNNMLVDLSAMHFTSH